MNKPCVAVLAIVTCLSACPLLGQEWLQKTKLMAGDRRYGDEFGTSVAVFGQTALIGADEDDDRGFDSGSVYVYERGDGVWAQTAKLTADDGASNDRFGISIAMYKDLAVIGAPYDDDLGSNSGSAYVFERVDGAWTQTTKLRASDGAKDDYFGSSVSLSDGTILIGAYGDDDLGSNSGSAYVFEVEGGGWMQTVKITATDGAESDGFGGAVALSGGMALIGAAGDDDLGSSSGSAYAFEKLDGAWIQTAKLTAADGRQSDLFGGSVAVSGDLALIGADQDDDRGSNSGSVYVFERVNEFWTQTAKLTADDGAVSDRFGASVALSGDFALVGADDAAGFDGESGSAYFFERTDCVWTQVAKHTALLSKPDDRFGHAVAIYEDMAVVGAPNSGERGIRSGLAYVYERGKPPECTGGEHIVSVACVKQRDVNVLTLQVASGDGQAPDDFTVTLSSGQSRSGLLKPDGKASIKLRGIPAGSGIATVTWGCGAIDERRFICDGWGYRTELIADDREQGAEFASSVALSGETALVGAPGMRACFVFERRDGAWPQVDLITAPDSHRDANFGAAVALSDDMALIGAYQDNDDRMNTDAAYVFRRTGGAWTPEANLTAADREPGDRFGANVALSGEIALVGARLDDDLGDGSGSAYVFEIIDGVWSQTAKLTASDGAAGDGFGGSVALSGAMALVGASGDDDLGASSGSAYVFEKIDGSWVQTAKLSAADGAAHDQFAESVALWGNVALLGAPGRESSTGSAYVFEKLDGKWTQIARFKGADTGRFDRFGDAVAVSGNTAVIGSPADDHGRENAGSAYVFEVVEGMWTQTAKLVLGNGSRNVWFGRVVASSGDSILAGIQYAFSSRSQNGNAFVFERGVLPKCTGEERISTIECTQRGEEFDLTVLLEGGNGAALDTFTITLSSGENMKGTLAPDGGATVEFAGVTSAGGKVRVEWGCGAMDEQEYDCP